MPTLSVRRRAQSPCAPRAPTRDYASCAVTWCSRLDCCTPAAAGALRQLRQVACRNGGDGAPRSTTTSRRLTISVLTAAAITTATTTAISLTTLTTTVADADRAK